MCINVLSVCVLCIMSVPGAHYGYEKTLYPLAIELNVFLRPHAGAVIQTRFLSEKQGAIKC